ncbi:DUF4082 domain-containing protein [Streptosporangium sp. NBC_01756]|uniref:DUF4082 domain-containing protein n=1 Tax=Streptosporangium sp. NBC_01756 TaxID=2975950 RepID=UPI002DD9B8B8|nr:DUF4082 domain-containing protein [Streptosporangium sp. NBC_01756]WSC87602.1 DUF4082 domain-containing protein [Streptosporangium sp. NBC_01756]
MQRQRLPIVVFALGVCIMLLIGASPAAWGLASVPRADPGGPTDTKAAGESRTAPGQPENLPGPKDAAPPEVVLLPEDASGPDPASPDTHGSEEASTPPDAPSTGGVTTPPSLPGSPRPADGSSPEGINPVEADPTPSAAPERRPVQPPRSSADVTGPGKNADHPTAGVGRGAKRTAGAARIRALRADCPPTSVICLENSLPGNPPSEWDIPGAGSSGIQGYGTTMSVNKGGTIQFKVDTDSTDYRVDIYRTGYYGGMGARKMTTISPSVPLPQTQPDCLSDPVTQLVDCGTWAVSASWAVPADAVSGVYLANLIRQDGTDGASQMIFVVRDDERGSDLLVQTSDATWQAYNTYGGASLYRGNGQQGRGFKVSYNRPFTTRGSTCCNGSVESWFFDSEYPMVRWMEANGYDVSYTTNIDTTARPAELLEHRLFISSGHDEYWSEEMRTNVQNALSGGVNLAFFSGNEVFWKTRWESSIDGSATPLRTLVCYKETLANAKIDPSPQWTGSWRDPRFSPPSNGGRPENALTGTWFRVNGVANNSLSVPAEFGDLRLWRNTSIATLPPGQTAVFPAGTLGYEWDQAPDNGSAPAGLVKLSRTIQSVPAFLLDFGSTYGPRIATHNLTLYKAASGALVFGAGTTQWAWGLDAFHDRPGSPTDVRMQQATVNLFADMHAQPASLQPNLVPATASTDTAAPTSTITNPLDDASLSAKVAVTIKGTATDTGGGVVAGIEVSVDGGTSWHPAAGRTDWQYRWTPTAAGTATIQVRAVDDIGNIQNPPTAVTVTVTSCPCTMWPATTVPAATSHWDPKAVEGGVKFRSASPGFITGVRFYKGALNTGTHVGNLWTSTGQLLAGATFINETDSGWQQVNFSAPVPIDAGTTYVASYHTTSGFYSITRPYFTTPHTSGPLTALANGTEGGNGVYTYSPTSAFPTSTYQATNYWVDVVFEPSNSLWDNTDLPDVPSSNDAQAITVGVKFSSATTGAINGIRFYKGSQNTGTHTGSLWTSSGQLLATATFTNESTSGWQRVNFSTPVPITAGTTYVASYHTTSGHYSTTRPYFTSAYTNDPLTAPADGEQGGNGVYTYGAANTFPTSTYQSTNYWVDVVFTPSNSLWDNSALPAVASHNDPKAVTLGVKFRSTTAGTIRGIRFYKGAQNTGPHTGSLWTSSGQLLATGTFTTESASGWQEMVFSTPVPITAGATYVASYHTTSGFYSTTRPYFTAPYTSAPLTALADGAEGGNGVYTYGAVSTFPISTYQATNYWVDVLLDFL